MGFRPFVHRLATSLSLRGRVRNDGCGVLVDLEGDGIAIHRFLEMLRRAPPPLAAIDTISVEPPGLNSYSEFAIVRSEADGAKRALIAPDAATCEACLAELFDPANRRYRHPFISCTHCGPRFTITHDVPYDRPRTTMADFPMCATCRAEYENPADRRFHAQPIACRDCGPVLEFRGTGGPTRGDAALEAASRALLLGRIVAVKGLGGYHLACDASHPEAVARLRLRKHREQKPFAIMVADLPEARQLASVSEEEAALLESSARPIVLLTPRASSIADGVAPGSATIGLMLAYTPVHHLLLQRVGIPLVLTSGNRSDEPIAFDDGDAVSRLTGVADDFLLHDRPIATRCDDSVGRVVAGRPQLLRRSRGYAPRPIRLRHRVAVPVLALGGHLKNTFCLARAHQALVSQHIGDLAHPGAFQALRQGIRHYRHIFGMAPEVVAHDLHPDYLSTGLASELPLPRVGVQHHHAHVASCCADNDVSEPVLDHHTLAKVLSSSRCRDGEAELLLQSLVHHSRF